MRKIFTSLVLLMACSFLAHADVFSFKIDGLIDIGDIGTGDWPCSNLPSSICLVPGPVTGEIWLNDVSDGTRAADKVLITGLPSGWSLPQVDATQWSNTGVNAFTLTGGVLTNARFYAQDFSGGGFAQLNLNENGNFFEAPGGYVYDNPGFAAADIQRADPAHVPEPSSMVLLGTSLIGVGALIRWKRGSFRAPR